MAKRSYSESLNLSNFESEQPTADEIAQCRGDPHSSAKARAAPISSLAIARPGSGSLHGPNNLIAAAARPIAPPQPIARIAFHGLIRHVLYANVSK
jgi:hypothetical protein